MAREAGFDLVGLAPLARPRAGTRFEGWLEAGRHADMGWLARNRPRILDPRSLLPGGKTILCVGLGHSRAAVELPGGGRVARYAAGRDYHNLVGSRLRRLARRLEAEGLIKSHRRVVDAGPLLERSHAAEAGLGFESKAANLLHPAFGPWFFLGELLLDVELAPTAAPGRVAAASCGSCRACIDACPTGAIESPGVVDSRRCISYQTIENRGVIPRELRGEIGEWAFGCDICSEVCPWGRRAPNLAERFGIHPEVESDPVSWIETGAEELAARRVGSPLQRARREGLARNAAIVLGNRPREEGLRALLHAVEGEESAMVRRHAVWALARGYGEERRARVALGRAERDPDPAVAAEARAST